MSSTQSECVEQGIWGEHLLVVFLRARFVRLNSETVLLQVGWFLKVYIVIFLFQVVWLEVL